jgi:hypothetical protein
MILKNAFFWDVASHLSRWFLDRGFFHPESRGDTFLRKVGSHKITRRHIPKPTFFIVTAVKTSNPTIVTLFRKSENPREY